MPLDAVGDASRSNLGTAYLNFLQGDLLNPENRQATCYWFTLSTIGTSKKANLPATSDQNVHAMTSKCPVYV